MIASTQITIIEIFAFIPVLVFKLLSFVYKQKRLVLVVYNLVVCNLGEWGYIVHWVSFGLGGIKTFWAQKLGNKNC